MVRKQTWILLVIFALLLGAAFYLQKNPLPKSADLTPSPTIAPKLLQGWQSSDIAWMELKEGQGSPIQIVQDAQGNWTLESSAAKEKVDTGKAEQLRTEIAEMHTTAVLQANYQLDVVGLDTPSRTLSIRDKQGKQMTINVGVLDPTESGYYVQIASQAPAVVDRYTLDGIVDQFHNVLPTPTPEPGTPTITVDPNVPTQTPSP